MKGHLYNMISSLKNGQIVKKAYIISENTGICRKLLNILWDEGYILGYTLITSSKLKIFLKYKSGKSVIKNIQTISKPSLRVYYSVKQLKKLDIFLILTTNKGFLTIDECKRSNIGGEPIVMVQ